MSKNRWTRLAAWPLFCGLLAGATAASGAYRFADSPYVVDRIPEEGLPQSSVISIVQNAQGYLWLGTLGGLVRFDGLRFKDFGEANLPGLTSSRIVCLFEDSHTNLWVGTENGGVLLIERNGIVRTIKPAQGNREERLVSVCEESGTVWLNTSGGGLLRYSNNKLDVVAGRFGPVIADKSGALWLRPWDLSGPSTNLFAIVAVRGSIAIETNQVVPVGQLDFLLASQSGGFWRLANGRVELWRDGRVERDLTQTNGSYPWGTVPITSAREDHRGNLIVGTLGAGVFWYNDQGKPDQIYSRHGLSHDTVLSLCMDREGDLWVGTDSGGLNRVKQKRFRVLEDSAGLNIQTACGDPQGGIWFANPGWKLFFSKDGTLKSFGSDRGLLDNDVRSVFVDRDQRVWVGTSFGGIFQMQGELFRRLPGSESLGPIAAIYQDRPGRVWFGGERGLVCRDVESWRTYTTREGLSTNSVKAIADDAEGNLWIGTERGGLNRWRDGRFTVYRKSEAGLPSDNVSALCADSDGVLWIGTSAGLARFQKEKWKRFTAHEGLASDSVLSLLDDGHGYLWIGSYAGLTRVSKESLKNFAPGTTNSVIARVYRVSDGLPTRECAQGSQPAACRTLDGRLWFCTIRGLVSVDPSEIKPNLYQPPVKIESVRVEDREQHTNDLSVEPLESIIIPAGKERLDIQYTSLNLGAADRSRFKYHLEGHETGWIDGNSREAHYSNLRPGPYRFQVKACNEDGIWNETGASLAITVLPSFWQTWWFTGLEIVLGIGLIAAVVYYFSTQKLQRQLAILKQKEALERERARIARDLHDQLGANLTQVALLGELAESDKGRPAEVADHARQISHTARETTTALDEIVWAVNPSNDTLDGLISYTCKYAQEYFELAGLRYRLDVPSQLPNAGLPPEVRHNVFLAAKEAINNVVKHAHAEEVWLRLKLAPDRFTIEIEDNGRGPGGMDEKTTRNGLRNMRRRMEDIGGSFSISPGPVRGTLVQLSAPIQNGRG